jgi:hypothetical protein
MSTVKLNDDAMVVMIREIKEVPTGFANIDATEGTQAWKYIQDVSLMPAMVRDPNYIGSIVTSGKDDRVLSYVSLFKDGSSVHTECGQWAEAEEA